MFLEDYKRTVKREAEYILKDILETADENDYERDLFLEDVIRKINETSKKLKEV